LKLILLALPDQLKSRVRQPPAGNAHVSIPLHKVLPQLGRGSVKITFGELREAAPEGVISDANDQDSASVELPLQEILSQLKPSQLPRRAAQKKVEVPEDVTAIFGAKGEALTSVRMASAVSKPLAPAVAKSPTPPIATPRPSIPAAPAQPAPRVTPIAPVQEAPIRPSISMPAPAALKPAAAPGLPQTTPIKPFQPAPAVPSAIPRPAVSAAPALPIVQPPAKPAGPQETLTVPLASVSGTWPDPIKEALSAQTGAAIVLPVDEIEQALKRGRIVFAWKRIRLLIRPNLSPSTVSALDDTQLELPLQVVAPLFLMHRKPVGPRKKYTITEDIPDMFQGKGLAPVAAPIEVGAPVAPTIAPSLPVAPAPAPVPVEPTDIGEVFNQPGRKNWTPSEIVQRTSGLKGVSGALIAMQDGLMVASHLPPGLNAETIAAFIPQMYTRMMQYCKELKFNEANSLTFIVDNVPLKIFKVGGVYFMVLGRDHQSLPEVHLSIVAAQLAAR
jgi:predicted regulator of Ras-like GTPase activity (Roadblock/LC7/MglB family)